jgi:hypothetical protein
MPGPLGAPLTASHPAPDHPLAPGQSRVMACLPDGTPTDRLVGIERETFQTQEP